MLFVCVSSTCCGEQLDILRCVCPLGLECSCILYGVCVNMLWGAVYRLFVCGSTCYGVQLYIVYVVCECPPVVGNSCKCYGVWVHLMKQLYMLWCVGPPDEAAVYAMVCGST
jgi:hypothetical protein